MIRINLAKRKRSGSQSAAGGILNGGFDLSKLFAVFKRKEEAAVAAATEGKKFDINGPIPKLLIAAALCWFVNDTLLNYKRDLLAVVDKDLAAIEKETGAVQSKLARIKGFEPIKKQLEDDERSIRTKLEVVSRLFEGRGMPAKMMLQIATSIPDEVWISELKVGNDAIKISGSTLGYAQVSDFIKSLSDSAQFGELALNSIQETNTGTRESRVQNFEIKAKRRDSQ